MFTLPQNHVNHLSAALDAWARRGCVLGILLQTGVGVLAEAATPEKESVDYINLLKNGGFEDVKDGIPSNWRYDGGNVAGYWELTKPGHEGNGNMRFCSDKPGYHGGVYQNFIFEGNRRYKISAWIKANISLGGSVILLYRAGRFSFMQNGQTTNKSWSGSAGARKTRFDWECVENTFETPTNAFDSHVYPVLLHGQGEVWIDDVRLVDLGPIKLGKETYSLNFDDPKIWKVSAHVDEKPSAAPEEVSIQSDDKNTCDGKPGLKLKYVFPSARHDAVLLTTDVTVPSGTMLALRVYGDGSGHKLDAVLYDKNGEAHYLPIGSVYWRGWKTVYKSFADLVKVPESKWDVLCEHWGGDKNQTLEFPITRIIIGLNDQPDSFKGNGGITFGWLKIYE